jgi:hypothetical protein
MQIHRETSRAMDERPVGHLEDGRVKSTEFMKMDKA